MAPLGSRNTQQIGFVLLPNFALMSYTSATEPLRAANLIAGSPLYEVVPLSADGLPVRSSAGLEIACGRLSDFGGDCHTLYVCAGGNPEDWRGSPVLHAPLRKFARAGLRVGGISSGAYVLAAAGLLDRCDFTIHWEHAPLLRETFPHLVPRQARFVIDGARVTCGGGVAPLDMMHAVIAERMGADFARRVSDWYLHTAIADPADPQRGSAAERFGTNHPALLSVLEKMETTIENPLGRAEMARLAGISSRHLDRLFMAHCGRSFLDTYRDLRLAHGRRLLEQSPLSIAEIAYATGFSSGGHFSRAFRVAYGKTPAAMRRQLVSRRSRPQP